jgi:protoheme ferro-lyase
MSDDDDDVIDVVVGPLVESMAEPTPGSMVWSADCGHEVWLSVSTQHFLVQHMNKGKGYEVMCPGCALKAVQEQAEESP